VLVARGLFLAVGPHFRSDGRHIRLGCYRSSPEVPRHRALQYAGRLSMRGEKNIEAIS
jgi:hypothetical protein